LPLGFYQIDGCLQPSYLSGDSGTPFYADARRNHWQERYRLGSYDNSESLSATEDQAPEGPAVAEVEVEVMIFPFPFSLCSGTSHSVLSFINVAAKAILET